MVKYLKKIWSFILVLTLVFTLFPTWENVKADTTVVASGNCGTYDTTTQTWGNNATWTLYNNGDFLISGSGAIDSGNTGPSYGLPWATYKNDIKKVTIQEGITSIPSAIFRECSSITTVVLPSTISSISYFAFSYCSSLENITIPSTVTYIGGCAFERCTSLKNITIPNSVTDMGIDTFYYCSSLENITLSNCLTRIPGAAFSYCTSLTDMTIPNSVTTICEYSFSNSSVRNINLDNVTSIITDAFENCNNVNIVCSRADAYAITYAKTNNIKCTYPTINDAEITLSQDTYTADKAEKKPGVTVKYKGETLAENTDYTLTYEDNVNYGTASVSITGKGKYGDTVVKNYTINGVPMDDTDIDLKKTIYTYDGSAKTPTVSITYNGTTLVQDTDYTLTYENNQDDGTAYAVITGMGMYTGTVKKSFVILPYNSGMSAVYPDGTLISSAGVYGVTDDENNEVEYCCPSTNKINEVVIPATITDESGTVYKVTSIGKEAFYKNTKIETLEIGNNVTSIEDYAFYGCKNLKSIKMGKGVEIIGAASFRKCTKLTSVTLPKSLNELGKNAFYGCKKLKTITIKANSVVDVNQGAIKGISKKAVIKVPKKLVKKYKKEFNKKSGYTSTMNIKKI